MTTITENYRDRASMIVGKSDQRALGFRDIHTNFINDQYTVEYNNDPVPTLPNQQMTQREFIDFLAEQYGIDLI